MRHWEKLSRQRQIARIVVLFIPIKGLIEWNSMSIGRAMP